MEYKLSDRSEVHLFIVWQKARKHQEQILADIAAQFEVIEVYEMRWGKKLFANNLTRFYGVNLPPGSDKEKHVGTGPFLVLIVRDRAPAYKLHDTSKGKRSVNSKTFILKTKHREWTGGGHRVHATDSMQETAHDLALLFGVSIDDFLGQHPAKWNGEVKKLKKDIAGARGWTDLVELFYLLKAAQHKYVILRNFDVLPHRFYMDKHGDIDLLVENYQETQYLINSMPVFAENYRVLNTVKVANQHVLFDFRHIGDGYFDRNWQIDLLNSRTHTKGGFFTPNQIDYFYSLLYHGLLHKSALADDYKKKLHKISKSINLRFEKSASREQMLEYLREFMFRRGYEVAFPQDASVAVNYSSISLLNTILV